MQSPHIAPWKGEVVHVDRRITFHKATRPSTSFANGREQGVASFSGPLGPGAALPATSSPPLYPAVPDTYKKHLLWASITRMGPGLVNVGNMCYVNTVLQVCAWPPSTPLWLRHNACLLMFCCSVLPTQHHLYNICLKVVMVVASVQRHVSRAALWSSCEATLLGLQAACTPPVFSQN